MAAIGTLQCSCFWQLLSQLPLQTSVQVYVVFFLKPSGVRVNSTVQNDLRYGSYCVHYMTKLMLVTFKNCHCQTNNAATANSARTSSTLTPHKAHQQRQQHSVVKAAEIVGYYSNVGCHFVSFSIHPFV